MKKIGLMILMCCLFVSAMASARKEEAGYVVYQGVLYDGVTPLTVERKKMIEIKTKKRATGLYKFYESNGILLMADEFEDGKLAGTLAAAVRFYEKGCLDKPYSRKQLAPKKKRIKKMDDLIENDCVHWELSCAKGKYAGYKEYYRNRQVSAEDSYKDGVFAGSRLYREDGSLHVLKTPHPETSTMTVREYDEKGRLIRTDELSVDLEVRICR